LQDVFERIRSQVWPDGARYEGRLHAAFCFSCVEKSIPGEWKEDKAHGWGRRENLVTETVKGCKIESK